MLARDDLVDLVVCRGHGAGVCCAVKAGKRERGERGRKERERGSGKARKEETGGGASGPACRPWCEKLKSLQDGKRGRRRKKEGRRKEKGERRKEGDWNKRRKKKKNEG